MGVRLYRKEREWVGVVCKFNDDFMSARPVISIMTFAPQIIQTLFSLSSSHLLHSYLPYLSSPFDHLVTQIYHFIITLLSHSFFLDNFHAIFAIAPLDKSHSTTNCLITLTTE